MRKTKRIFFDFKRWSRLLGLFLVYQDNSIWGLRREIASLEKKHLCKKNKNKEKGDNQELSR